VPVRAWAEDQRTDSRYRKREWTDGDKLHGISRQNQVCLRAVGRRTTPGRCMSRGNFCVISRYKKAAEIMKAMRHPVPCVVMAHMATAVVFMSVVRCEAVAAAMRFPAKGAVRSSGYAGKTQVGVIM
jgi:hypothetical protein